MAKRLPHISIAPMMDCTDRHYRYFMRLITKRTLLYTEMVTANAVIHGDRERLIGFNATEHPVALQLGGSDPTLLASAARIGADSGYDEINLNVGCPSSRVQAGCFGAALMKQPDLVAECVSAMQSQVSCPVTVKCRIGVDDQDSYEALHAFVEKVAEIGCKTLIVHARKAWLKGLSPKENREVPPLQYDIVYRLKQDFPALTVVMNGGIKTWDAVDEHLTCVDGVMLGREAYKHPYLFAAVDQRYFASAAAVITERELVAAYLPYVLEQVDKGVRLSLLIRPLIGLFQGQPGARAWRRRMSEGPRSGMSALELLGPGAYNCLNFSHSGDGNE